MMKYVRLDKSLYSKNLRNNLRQILDSLALAEGLSANGRAKRWTLRSRIIQIYQKRQMNNNEMSAFSLSHKSIKRLERTKDYIVPVNVVDFLEILVEEVTNNIDTFDYAAKDAEIVSCHILYYSLSAFKVLKGILESDKKDIAPENEKYRSEVAYIKSRLEHFDEVCGYRRG